MIYNVNLFTGTMGMDQMCFDPNISTTCLSEPQPFFLADNADEPYLHQGYIGVGPVSEDYPTNYVTKLYKENKIPSEVLTFWYNTQSIQSEIVFGGLPNSTITRDGYVVLS